MMLPKSLLPYCMGAALAGLLAFPPVIAHAQSPKSPGTVSTVAGFGYMDRSGVDINLVSPGLITADDYGYTYFPDTGNHIVYRRDPWNILDIMAGDGIPGFSGDGGPASKARLNTPKGAVAVGDTVADFEVDGVAPAIYIADTGNRRVRKIARENGLYVIRTLAGDGTEGDKGDGGPALQASFVSPEGIIADKAGTVYVADRLAHRVRKISPDGIITTVAGTGKAGFGGDGGPAHQAELNEPAALYLDSSGSLYISDQKNDRIRKVAKDGTISTFVGGGSRAEDGGTGPETAISRPSGMAMDFEGNFFFTDGLRVRALMNGKVRTVAGNGMEGWTGEDGFPPDASFRNPIGLAVPLVESLVITDDRERRLRRIYGLDESGVINTGLGSELWDDTEATGGKITLPVAVSPMADGRMLIADFGNRRVRSVEPPRNPKRPRIPLYLYTVAGNGLSPALDGAAALDVELGAITGVAGSVGGPYYFSEGPKGRVWKVDESGKLAEIKITGLVYPAGLSLRPDGSLLIADRDAARIWKVAPDGGVVHVAGTEPGDGGENGPATHAQLREPMAALAADGSIYIADTGNHKIKRVAPNGSIKTVAGTGTAGYAASGLGASTPLNAPQGVAIGSDGNVYIADTMNHRIARLKGDGTLENVAGNGEPGKPEINDLTGDDTDSPSEAARFFEPAGITFDGQGNLYVADRHNHRIRVIWQAAASGNAPTVSHGDVNEDGKINVQDAIMALRIAVRVVTPTESQKAAADVAPSPGKGGRAYGDGRVDTLDAIRILRRSLGIIKKDQWP